jgi:hypothetical protein
MEPCGERIAIHPSIAADYPMPCEPQTVRGGHRSSGLPVRKHPDPHRCRKERTVAWAHRPWCQSSAPCLNGHRDRDSVLFHRLPARRSLPSALRQEQLDVTQAQAEDVIQPHGVADDLGRKPVSGIGCGLECPPSLADWPWTDIRDPLLPRSGTVGYERACTEAIASTLPNQPRLRPEV